MKKAVIWDLDGTLFDSYDVIVESICLEYALKDKKRVRKMVKTALTFDNVQAAIRVQVESYLQSIDYLMS